MSRNFKSVYNTLKQNGGKNDIDTIIDFFEETFFDSAFGRMVDINEDFGYEEDDKDKFIKYNKNIIKKLSKDDINFLLLLIKKIKKEEVELCDEESCISFVAYTFYYNKEGKLVIVNER